MSRLRQAPRHRAANQSPPPYDQHAQRFLRWARVLLPRVLWSGAVASMLSTAMVSAWSRRVTGSLPAGTNATSQWVWGDRARRTRGWSWRHTGLGYLIHHASSVFWSVGYEAWCARAPRHGLAKAAAVAAVAYVVDYHVVPPRLSPGFEKRVSPAGMFCAYAGFALGLALARRVRLSGADRLHAPRHPVSGLRSRRTPG